MGDVIEQLGLNGLRMLLYAVNFIILFAVLYLLLYKPVKKMIKERRDSLEAIYSENEKLNKEAISIKTAYEDKLEEKKREFAKINEEMIKAAEEKSASIINDANRQARAILDSATEELDKEEQRLNNRFKQEASELGLKIASAVLQREVGEKDNDKIIDEALSNWDS